MANPRGPKRRMYTPATMISDEDGVGEQPVGRQHRAERDRRRRGQYQQRRGDPDPLDRGLVDRDVADHRQHRSHDHHGGLLAGELLERDGQREREDDRQQRARRQAQPDEARVDTGGGGAQLGPARAQQAPPPRPLSRATCHPASLARAAQFRFGRAEPSARVVPTRRAASGDAMSSSDLPSASTARKNATTPPMIMITAPSR